MVDSSEVDRGKGNSMSQMGVFPLRSLRSRVIVRALFPIFAFSLVGNKCRQVDTNKPSFLYLLDDTSVGQVRHTEVTVTTHKDRTKGKRRDIVLKRVGSAGKKGTFGQPNTRDAIRTLGYYTRPKDLLEL